MYTPASILKEDYPGYVHPLFNFNFKIFQIIPNGSMATRVHPARLAKQVLSRWDAVGINADGVEARRILNASMSKGLNLNALFIYLHRHYLFKLK